MSVHMLSTSCLQALAMSPKIIDVVQDPSMGGGEDSGHELVFMMHLLKQLNGSNALLDFLDSTITADLPFLIPYKRKLTVSCGHVCVCLRVSVCLSVCLFEYGMSIVIVVSCKYTVHKLTV